MDQGMATRRLVLACACVLLVAGLGIAAAQDCTTKECRYLPAVIKGVSTPHLGEPTEPPPPPTQNECQADPNPGAAPNYPVRITAIDKEAETVTLRNVTVGDTIDLTNWTMCSVTGNQMHPISGTLTPGQSQTFPGPAGPIWNNSTSDPGALYNPNGQLVSYWPD